MMEIELQVVVSSADMDSFNFELHMECRHEDSLGGLVRLNGFGSPAVEEAYRAFHDRLHKLRVGLEHTHLE